MDLPQEVSDLTPTVLTGLLGSRVDRVVVEDLPGSSLWGSVSRLRLEWSGPSVLIAKLANSHAQTIAWTELRVYEREVLWYSELARDAGVEVPLCFVARSSARDRRSVLILEDLSQRAVQPSGSLSPKNAREVVTALARLHAKWWESGTVHNEMWLARFPLEEPATLNRRTLGNWFRFAPLFAGHLTQSELEQVLVWVEDAASWWTAATTRPWTLCHGDVRLGNLLFGDAPIFIDWQFVSATNPAHDLANVLGECLEVEVRRMYEDALIACYLDVLRESDISVSPPDLRRWLSSWAVALLMPIINSVQRGEESQQYGRSLAIRFRRALAFARDHSDHPPLLSASS